MKKVLIAAAFAGLMLTACSSNKDKAPEANLTVEQAMQECQKTVGNAQDQAAFDACMKDKGFERPAAAPASAPAM